MSGARRIRPGRPRGRRAFTLVELLVVVAIIALLVSILIPTVRSALYQARTAFCKTNLKAMHAGFIYYADDYQGWLPNPMVHDTGATPRFYYTPWNHRMAQYTANRYGWVAPKGYMDKRSVVCPADPLRKADDRGSYGLNGRMGYDTYVVSGVTYNYSWAGDGYYRFTETQRPADMYLVGDVFHDAYSMIHAAASSHLEFRHPDGANMLYHDGHVEAMIASKVIKETYRYLPWWNRTAFAP